ncbi:uncharacterized protein LOC117172002 isoform X2 [Belonocnema kinseyi]|uniref:uncharacterized protein LOC117172002 isoform X2 n=1 Tax=Belonocnema kinseyi TaxID=2817044 RepID=UPI00143D2208|nr:uncharacterized protein LOC117172002 isoform X2 [Belonocnema kinseyi]
MNLERELNDNGSINGLDSATLEIEDVSESESESEAKHDEMLENSHSVEPNQLEARLLRLASQESDDVVLKNVKEYRRNFDGFVKIVPFDSIYAMHEYIRANLRNLKPEECENSKQASYLNIILRIKPEDRFNKLLEFCEPIVRRILVANKGILEELLITANIEKLPCPIASDSEDSGEFSSRDDEDYDFEASIKPWYMLELIGMWLNFVNDPQSFRDELKTELLHKRLGGISVPLKYK